MKFSSSMKQRFSAVSGSIQTRIILLFMLTLTIVFLIAGFFLRWYLRSVMDVSLGRNLESLAALAAADLDEDLLLTLQSGDEMTRTYQHFQNRLHMYRRASGVRRIYIFSTQLTSLVDTDSTFRIGQPYFQLRVMKRELNRTFLGKPSSSILFEGADQRLYKTAFAPIYNNQRVVAGLAVEGSADMLQVVDDVQRYLLVLSGLALLGSLIISSLFARQIIHPVRRLAMAARRITRGDLQSPIPETGQAEIAVLRQSMEVMRQSILARDKRQQAMLASVAHEIRNPLGGIELFAGMLADDIDDPELESYARRILSEVQNLKKIIQDFLAFAKPSPPHKSRCRISEIWREAAELMGKELESISVRFDCTPEVDEICIDPQHLKQIFLNLLTNSVRVLPEGGTIFVSIRQQDRQCEIRFADDGPGIAEQHRPHIFEPFFTTDDRGTGLGLAVVKNLIAENNGTIQYEENSPSGAVFILHFPKD